MKKIFTFFVALFATMTVAMATTTKTYSGTLKIKVLLLESTQKNVEVYYDDNGGSDDQIRLKNMYVTVAGAEMAVGNITVVNVSNSNGTILSNPSGSDNNILLSDGDDPADEDWIGSSIGGVQGTVTGTISGDNIKLSIPLKVSGMSISINYEGKLVDASVKDIEIDNSDAPSYRIDGVRAGKNTKGLVIKNGKKFIQQ